MKGWRTIIWNGLLTLASAIIAITDYLRIADLSAYFTPAHAVLAVCVIIAVNVILRAVTTTRVGGC